MDASLYYFICRDEGENLKCRRTEYGIVEK